MAKNPDHYAIVIGIDSYPQLRRLRSANTDATKFYEWLIDPNGGGLEERHVKVILSSNTLPDEISKAQPIQEDIDNALAEFGVENGNRIGKRLYFYFAGHGMGSDFDDVAMLMANASMYRLNNNIGLRSYRSYFHNSILFDEIVFFVDCCRDPSNYNVQVRNPVFTLPVPVPNPAVNDYVLLAAGYGEKAFSPIDNTSGERRGLLTMALLEGLNGKATDSTGTVTAASLSTFVKTRVIELATDEKLKQSPEDFGTPPINFFSSQNKIIVKITLPPNFHGDFVLRNSNFDEIARFPVVSTSPPEPWEVELLEVATPYLITFPDGIRSTLLFTSQIDGGDHVFEVPGS